MSSMFKKKGGLAFKPKAPPVRRADAAAAAPKLATNLASAAVAQRPENSPVATQASSTARADPVSPPKTQGTLRQPTSSPSAPDEPARKPAAASRTAQIARSTGPTKNATEELPVNTGHETAPETTTVLPPTPPATQTQSTRPSGTETETHDRTETRETEIQPQHGKAAGKAGKASVATPVKMTRGRTAAQSQLRDPSTDENPAIEPAIIAIGVAEAAHTTPSDSVATAPTVASTETTAPRRGRPRAASKAAAAAAAAAAAIETQDGAPCTSTSSTEEGVAAAAAPKKRKYTRRKTGGEADEGAAVSSTPRPRRAATRKRPAAALATERVVPTVETAKSGASAATPPATATPGRLASVVAPKRARRERSVTPEDAESRTVDHRELRMEDLTKDLRIGKKFSRHDELVDRLREKRRQYRRERLLSKKIQGQSPGLNSGALSAHNSSRDGSVLGDESGLEPDSARGNGNRSGGGHTAADILRKARATDAVTAAASVLAAATASVAKMQRTQQAVTGPQFEIIDGAIVVNQASLVHDRHAAAAAEAGELEEVEENDFTRQTTSNTYLKPGKLRGPNAWTEAETELFYRALSMFGTSFDLICKWFPGKSRRHIKMKFNREDKLRPQRITEALVGQNKVAIDVDEYMARTGLTLHATETIDAEYALRQAEHDAEQQRIVDEQQEALRKKREALFGPRNGGGDAAGKDRAGSDGGSGGGASGSHGGQGATGGGGNDDEIDETDMVSHGKTRGRRSGRYGGRHGGTRQAVAGGFGI